MRKGLNTLFFWLSTRTYDIKL